MYPNFSFKFIYPVDISAYAMFFWLALFVFLSGGYFFATRQMKLNSKKVFGCLMVLVSAGILGARALNGLVNWDFYAENLQRLWSFKLQGFSVFGAVLAVPLGYLYCRIVKLNVWKMADSTAIFLGFAIALMRVGCFLNGCCFGKATTVPWGVNFPDLSRAHIHQMANYPLGFLSGPVAVHPTQLYELFAALLGSTLAFWLIKKQVKSGIAFLIFATSFSFFRLVNNFLRVPPETFDMPFLFYPMFYLSFIFLGSVFIFFKK